VKKYWPIILILLIAAFCRFYRLPEYMEFLGDQGRDVVIVRDFLKNGNFFFIGPQTSIGNMYLGPYYYYLIAPALLLVGFSPIGPAAFVALLGVLTVFLLYKIATKWFNLKVGLISALLFALSPVVIKYSSFSWNPNIMPLFSLLFIYFLVEKRYLLASLAFIFCLNSHYLALLLIFPALYILVLNYKKSDLKSILLALLIFILSFTPQILFDIKHQGQNIGAIITFFTNRETTVNLKAYKALPVLPQIFNQVSTRLLAGKNEAVGIYVSIVFLALLILLLLKNKFDSKQRQKLYLCLIWFFSGLAGLALYKQHIYDHYFGFIYPVIFILIGLGLDRLGKIWGSFLLIVLIYLSLLQNPFRWSPPRQLQTTDLITSSIIESAAGAPFNFALLAKMNYDPGYLYLFYEKNAAYYHLRDRLTDQLFVACDPFQIDCNPINNPEWGIAAFGWAKIDSQWEINGIKVFRLVHNPSGQ
jgi:4-amino-4-deoxy-L-arabinose transferase-like glycosyltransferase